MKTRATAAALSILLAMSLLGLVTNSSPVSATPTTIQASLGDSIQEAINNANPGDTILVAAGTYRESLVINKTLTLTGSGKTVTIIEGQVSVAVITIRANNVNISGFTIQSGLKGVSLVGYNASVISNNIIISNTNQGIDLQFSHSNKVLYNTIALNSFEGLHLGNSTNNLISNNAVTRNENVGIELFGSTSNRISNNTIVFHEAVQFHDQGIWISDASNGNTFDGNTVSKNAWGVDIYSSSSNVFHHNNFINNTNQADRDDQSPSNAWDNGAEGNYWSDYVGQDINPPVGIGDTPYPIGFTGDQDNFPLMSQWNPVMDVTPPLTVDDYNGAWHTMNFTITLTAADDFSGVQAIYYKINNGSTMSVNANGQPYITRESGNNTLEYWSTDVAGNMETPHRVLAYIKLDKTSPSGSIIINNGDTYTTSNLVTLNLSANDVVSGVSQMRFSDNGMVWTQWEQYITSKTLSLPSGDGVKKVFVQFRDNALLPSQMYDDSIVLDTTGPVISVLSPSMNSQLRSSTVTIEWNGTDAGLGVDHFEIQLDGGFPINVETRQNHTFTGLSDGSHIVKIKGFDKLGRLQETSVSFTVNTNPIGYIEISLIIIAAIIAGIAIYIFKIRKRKVPTKVMPDKKGS